MPRAGTGAPVRERAASLGSFESDERVSSVMEDLQQIQSARKAARQPSLLRAASQGQLNEPLVSQQSPPSPPADSSPAAGGSYFSIAGDSKESREEKCSSVVTWLLFTLLVFALLMYMANTDKLLFAKSGTFNVFGTCGLSGHAEQRPFEKFDFLHTAKLKSMLFIGCVSLGVLLFLQLVIACSRGHCALGAVKQNGKMLNTNRNVKLTRVCGWLGTAAVIIAVQISFWLVLTGWSCSWAPKRIFELFAAVSAGSAIVLGLLEIMNHVTNYYRPKLQRHIGRVLLMVPIYALDSLITVFVPGGNPEVVCGAIRSLWEAYTIYSFYMFVLEYLQGLAVLRVIEDEVR